MTEVVNAPEALVVAPVVATAVPDLAEVVNKRLVNSRAAMALKEAKK